MSENEEKIFCPVCRTLMTQESEEFVVCENQECIIDELASEDWYAINQRIERAFYDGIMFCVNGKHAGGTTGTTGALEEAKAYMKRESKQ